MLGALLVVVVIGIVVLTTEGGHGSSSYVGKVESVSMREPLKAGHQWVCVSGNHARSCTAVGPTDPGAPFRVGDCVSIDTQTTGRRWTPRPCD